MASNSCSTLRWRRSRKGEVVVKGKRIRAKYILAAPGRVGATWFAEQTRALGIKSTHGAIDVGVRVEVPAVVYEPVVKVNRDPKFHIITKTFDDFVRTFCTNHQGYVMEERYDDHVGVNGQSLRARKSHNTNFAFLVHIDLTQPVTDTTSYGQSIAYLATTIGGGRPLAPEARRSAQGEAFYLAEDRAWPCEPDAAQRDAGRHLDGVAREDSHGPPRGAGAP